MIRVRCLQKQERKQDSIEQAYAFVVADIKKLNAV